MAKKHNILQLIETGGPGGAETVFLQLAENIGDDNFGSHAVLLKRGFLYDTLRQHGINTQIIKTNRSWDILFLTKLIRTCREMKIDIIHSHLSGTNLYACLAGAILRRPVICTIHNEVYLPGSRESYRRLKSFLIGRLTTRLVLVAEFLKNDLSTRGNLPAERMQTIYNGIAPRTEPSATETAALREELGIGPDDLVVGIVANLRPAKGLDTFVAAAELVSREFDKIKFLMIGEGKGEPLAILKTQIKNLNLEDRVILAGFRPDAAGLIFAMDMLVLSSVSEGMPMVLIEAMAASRPIVATDVGGISEVVVDGRTGFLAAPRNPRALADRIIALLRNRSQREAFGANGKKLVLEKFSLERMLDSYRTLYKEVASG